MTESNRYIPYALPLIGEEEIQAVTEVLRSDWITTGPKTKQFEADFAHFVDAPHAVALNSCTAALHLALLAAGVGPGDEVITTPLTFCATVNTILHVGATPVLADVDPVTLCLSPEAAAAKITPRTKAIIPVHYAGHPAEMDAFLALAQEHGLAIIEDAAHAVGTSYRGRKVGSIGDYTAFSFYATKNLTTAEGGMLTTPHAEAADRIRVMGLHGISRDAWKRYTAAGSWYYEVQEAGFKYNMTDMAAALGLAQMARFDAMQQVRRCYADRYNQAFAGLSALELPPGADEAKGDVHAWHLYVIRLNPEALTIDRDAFLDALKEEGVGTSVHFIPITHHPFYQRTLGVSPTDTPVATAAYSRMLSLPLYPKMTPDDVSEVIRRTTSLLERHRR
ncbi:UDP-4-amino-4-deoxy-L-arabinose--oxoglutarate aminotransferase [compost metagenome]